VIPFARAKGRWFYITLCAAFCVAASLCVAAILFLRYVSYVHYASRDDIAMMEILSFFARRHGRMPKSLGELIERGYLVPTGTEAGGGYWEFIPGQPNAEPLYYLKDLKDFEIAWGVGPADLVVRKGRLYYRKRPNQEALLIVRRALPGSWFDVDTWRDWRDWSLRLYRHMLEAPKKAAVTP